MHHRSSIDEVCSRLSRASLSNAASHDEPSLIAVPARLMQSRRCLRTSSSWPHHTATRTTREIARCFPTHSCLYRKSSSNGLEAGKTPSGLTRRIRLVANIFNVHYYERYFNLGKYGARACRWGLYLGAGSRNDQVQHSIVLIDGEAEIRTWVRRLETFGSTRVQVPACLESMSVVWFPASSETFQ